MKYQNRIPPEGINTPGRHPLKEFLRLSLFAVLALVSVALLLNYGGSRLGGLVPFKVERWVMSRLNTAFAEAGEESPFGHNVIDTPLEAYLNQLSQRVQQGLDLKEPLSITLHYSEEDTFNAYATLGGHVTLYRGLLKQLPNENALAMLMAHEFSHVQLRHPVRGVSGGLAVAIGTNLLSSGSLFDSRAFSLASQITTMSFSRDMERAADESGLVAVQKIYGHVNGAAALFELFMGEQGKSDRPLIDTFFSTHPLDAQRIESIARQAQAMEWSTEGELTPLPAEFEYWLNP